MKNEKKTNLLAKTGDKKEAVKQAELAITKAKETGDDYKDMEELVKKNQSLVNQKVEGKGKSVKINYAFILSVLIAVGGMFSTAKDLYKWQQALFADKILSKKKREKLLTPNNQTSRGTHAYGWFISEIKSGANGYWTA